MNDSSGSGDTPAQLEVIKVDEVIPVGDAELIADFLNFDRFDNFLVLNEAGRGDPVGEDEAVTDEVAIVGHITEVAAVSDESVVS